MNISSQSQVGINPVIHLTTIRTANKNPDLKSITVTEKEVVDILQHLDPQNTTGPDNLSPSFLIS